MTVNSLDTCHKTVADAVSPPHRAGATDSTLTNHGMIQIQRLAQYFVRRGVTFTQVFSSDLKRAKVTAEGICAEQGRQSREGSVLAPLSTSDLGERHFGSLEGTSWQSTHVGSQDGHCEAVSEPASSFIEQESEASMRTRAHAFLGENLLPVLLDSSRSEATIAVVSHGIILRVLWSCLVDLFDPAHIHVGDDVSLGTRKTGMPFLPVWSNTGFMELCFEQLPPVSTSLHTLSQQNITNISRSGPRATDVAPKQIAYPGDTVLSGLSMTILSVDNKDHLGDLHRTRGGIGNAMHDDRQQRIDNFFGRSGTRC
jgi:broad specificity phosphatase PhoE